MIFSRIKFRFLTYLALILWPALLHGSAAPTLSLPVWQGLEFEYKAFWATARSSVEVFRDTEDPDILRLSADNSVASAISWNGEKKRLKMSATNGQLLQRSRYSNGNSERMKIYDYLPQHIARERRDPGEIADQAPEEWPLSNRVRIKYPQLLPEKAVITDSYALLVLADRFKDSPEKSKHVIVQTDFNFYQVRMTHSIDITIPVNYKIKGGKRISGPRKASAVTLLVEPLGELHEEADFDLMGLHGRLILLFDKETGVPVQLRGSAPRIGDAQIDLKQVVMRNSGS